jgi:putative glutamine amidotransferase
MGRPLIGITTEIDGLRHSVAAAYSASVRAAGGIPILLPCEPACAADYVRCCDGVIMSGGDDPIMEQWQCPTHPKATRLDPRRQAFELAILAALDDQGDRPLLGICLGMQLMGLHRGGTLDQHLPESLPTADCHGPASSHAVDGSLGHGDVQSHHHQALSDPGCLCVVARAPDGVIEAVRDESRPFYVGVQWHPERTGDTELGAGLFRQLVEACPGAARSSPHASPAFGVRGMAPNARS